MDGGLAVETMISYGQVADPVQISPAPTAPSVLKKAFDVLGSFSPDRSVLSFAQISRRSGLPKSTTHRVLAMLLEMEAIEQHDGGYRVGLRMFSVGSCSAEVALRNLAMPAMEALHRMTRQTLHLAVLRGPDIVYIEKLRTHLAIPTPAVVGSSLPAHITAVGKSLLASAVPQDAGWGPPREPNLTRELALTRSRGWATDREESVAGLACIAVPIVTGGSPVAALSVAFPSHAGTGEILLSSLREAATTIGRAVSPDLATSLSQGTATMAAYGVRAG